MKQTKQKEVIIWILSPCIPERREWVLTVQQKLPSKLPALKKFWSGLSPADTSIKCPPKLPCRLSFGRIPSEPIWPTDYRLFRPPRPVAYWLGCGAFSFPFHRTRIIPLANCIINVIQSSVPACSFVSGNLKIIWNKTWISIGKCYSVSVTAKH